MEPEKCYCTLLSGNKSRALSAWESFGADSVTETIKRRKDVVDTKAKRLWNVRSRYGYETLDDKYKFSHCEDIHSYIEEYRNMFSVANRAHKKSRRSNPTYRHIDNR